jgi:hypothetical protein
MSEQNTPNQPSKKKEPTPLGADKPPFDTANYHPTSVNDARMPGATIMWPRRDLNSNGLLGPEKDPDILDKCSKAAAVVAAATAAAAEDDDEKAEEKGGGKGDKAEGKKDEGKEGVGK